SGCRPDASSRRSGPEVQAIPDAGAHRGVAAEPVLRVDKRRDVVSAEAHEIDTHGQTERGVAVSPLYDPRITTLPWIREGLLRATLGFGVAPRDVTSEPGCGPQTMMGELHGHGDVGDDRPVVVLLGEAQANHFPHAIVPRCHATMDPERDV